jgi:hypothetical protein
MASDSKILTVSYGTFSCTLEGFDDPFNTMKAIAEYFRDLSAEDRYFGAVPPQPDPAMLHRVADREVSRLVGSKARDAGLVLRPSDLAATEGRVTGRPRTARAPVDEPAAPQSAPSAEPALQDAMPTGVVAKLARIREAVSQPVEETRSAPELPEDLLNAFREEVEDLAPAAELPVAGAEAFTADAASRIGALLLDPEAAPGAAGSDENIFADLSLPEPAGEDIPEVSAEAEDAAPFMVADEIEPDALAGAEAVAEIVTSEGDPSATLAPVLLMPEMLAPGPSPESSTDEVAVDDAVADLRVPAAASGSLQDEAALLDADQDDVAVADGLAVDVALQEAELEDAAALEVAAEDAVEASEPLTAASEDEIAADTLAQTEETLSAATDADADETDADETEAPLPTTRNGAKTRRVSSRVVRIHAEEDDADDTKARPGKVATRMISLDEAENLSRLMQQAEDVMADEENRRRIDSLAHLKAAVAATEADRAAGEEMRSPDAPDADAYREDLSQVVQPDPEPAAPEVRPRRKTVSVRPQEPRPGTIRPGMISPPPLVLVSEQRIDRIVPVPEAPAAKAPAPLPGGPSQPGIEGQPMVALRTGRLTGAIGIGAAAASPVMQTERIVLNRATPAPAVEAEDEDGIDEQLSPAVEAGLASFADSVGVKSMVEMLEAAAAYATIVERREQFTRPQLMRRLMASAGGKPVSREDGLRSFGTLLRTGRIEKVGRGHYVLAEQSPYLAEARRFH